MSLLNVVSNGLNFYAGCRLFEEKFGYYFSSKIHFIFRNVLQNTANSMRIAESVEKCDILLDSVWETINIGHWRDVDVFWRQVYRSVCFIKSANLFCLENFVDALKACDMGLIMGAPVHDEMFVQYLADVIQSKLVICTTVKPKNTEQPNKSELKPPWLPNPKIIPEFDSPSLEHFIQLVAGGTPFIMKNTIMHWPASQKWCPDYLLEHFGCRTVPIEIGSSYTSDKWSQKLVTLREFIETYMLNSSNEVAYLAQYELFNHITKLKDDIIPLDYCAVSGDSVVTNCWFGPEGTVSPLHHDQYQNLFCQVYGYKRFTLFERTADMRPHSHHLLENTSQIDIESPLVLDEFPDYADMTAWFADLCPGDVLYIPMSWWHHVRSISPSFSVSFWWKK